MVRAGHSLPELVVALTFLGVSMGAVGAAGLAGVERSARAARATEAMLVATAVLDSAAVPGAPAAAGAAVRDVWRVEWQPTGPLHARVLVYHRRETVPVVDLELPLPPAPPPPSLPALPAGSP